MIIKGNAINRQYKFHQKNLRKGLFSLGVSLPMAGLNAYSKDAVGTVLWGGTSFLSVKVIELAKNRMLRIQDSYKAIVDRAKQIKALKK